MQIASSVQLLWPLCDNVICVYKVISCYAMYCNATPQELKYVISLSIPILKFSHSNFPVIFVSVTLVIYLSSEASMRVTETIVGLIKHQINDNL